MGSKTDEEYGVLEISDCILPFNQILSQTEIQTFAFIGREAKKAGKPNLTVGR